jgi:porin
VTTRTISKTRAGAVCAAVSPLLVATLLVGSGGRAAAQEAPPPAGDAAASSSGPSFFTGLFAPSRSTLLGDMGGLRTGLGNLGISLGLQETSEVLGNVTGGVHTGFDYDGLTEMSLGLDTQKAFGWPGGTFNMSALQIHGRNLSTDNLDTLQTASGIEADRATRLWELWYQQAFLNGAADIKLGQQSIDQEFMVSAYAGLFINTAMGWPVLPSENLYAGGPAYPLSSLGVRLRATPLPRVTVLAGVFNDNPPGGPFNDDSQLRGAEAAGLLFNMNTGALWITEIQYALNQPAAGEVVTPDSAPLGLPGTYKLGFWYDSATFPDQRLDTMGVSLASPASNGMPRMHRGNYSVYAVVDQMIWQPDPEGPQSVGLFLRAMGAPADRNLITFSANGGVTLKAPLPGRDNDTAGIGFGVAQVSSVAAQLDRDTGFYTGTHYPVRSTETFIEATYQYQVAAWWIMQPDLQYVFRPGAGIPNPVEPSKIIGNELVLGLRTQVTF